MSQSKEYVCVMCVLVCVCVCEIQRERERGGKAEKVIKWVLVYMCLP